MKPGLLVVFLLLAGSSLLMVDCSGRRSPSAPAPGATETFTPTSTGATPAATASGTVTPTFTSIFCVNAQGTPCTLSPTSTMTVTATSSPTSTVTETGTATPTPTGTWYSPTFTPTPIYTGTACWTPYPTATGSPPPTPVYNLSGSITYTGTGAVDAMHPVYVKGGDRVFTEPGGFDAIYSSEGTYRLGYRTLTPPTPVVGQVYAVYDLNGLTRGDPNYFIYQYPVPGERYTTAGICSNPVSAVTSAVTIGGTAGSTFIGPDITLGDSCSYWGIYGTAVYTGQKGTLGDCRWLNIEAFSDPAYSSSVESASVAANGATYFFVTNKSYYFNNGALSSAGGTTGLSTLYVRAWFDANGDSIFDAGDPYDEVGPVTPTADGLRLDISFGDANIK